MKLTPLPKFDWSKVLVAPPKMGTEEGYQIMHFTTKNKPYLDNSESKRFVEKYLSQAQPLQSDADVLRYGSDAVTLNGAYLEMGVCTGKTINFIAALNPRKKIYGFDSFEGLPEDWNRDVKNVKGTFSLKEKNFIPPVLGNVILYKGLFNEVLPAFNEEILKNTPIAFLHMDCDLYSSTTDVFNILGSNIVDGTIIVFDEFYNFSTFEQSEWKALNEFLAKSGFQVEYIAFNEYHEQVAVRIINS